LEVFETKSIHASWATVGLLGYKYLQNQLEDNQNSAIGYEHKPFCPFPLNSEKYLDIPFTIISAHSEIEAILNTEYQELASHTYSHYYTLEKGQSKSDFENDLLKMKGVGSNYSTNFKSIVFPRNQINPQYLKLCHTNGYQTYRGNQQNNLWSNSPFAKESLTKKGKRYVDAYYNISNTQSVKLDSLEIVEGLINIPANRFLRPNSGKSLLEKRKVKRIKEEMSNAAIKGEIYHLWWHPHNFSHHMNDNFNQLEEIINHFEMLNKKHGFLSLNMQEIGSAASK
jgi:hypothetical protein